MWTKSLYAAVFVFTMVICITEGGTSLYVKQASLMLPVHHVINALTMTLLVFVLPVGTSDRTLVLARNFLIKKIKKKNGPLFFQTKTCASHTDPTTHECCSHRFSSVCFVSCVRRVFSKPFYFQTNCHTNFQRSSGNGLCLCVYRIAQATQANSFFCRI